MPPDEEIIPLCSIVIPTKDGGELFLKVLDALVKQTIWKRTELIVIDSGSQDNTVAFAKLVGARVFEILVSSQHRSFPFNKWLVFIRVHLSENCCKKNLQQAGSASGESRLDYAIQLIAEKSP